MAVKKHVMKALKRQIEKGRIKEADIIKPSYKTEYEKEKVK
jgi:hypothetical protein